MGNSHSQLENEGLFKDFVKEQWKRQRDLGICELWQNTKSGELCQAYKLDYIPRQEDLQHYRFRHYNQNADNFVEIRYVDIQKNPCLCNHGQSYVLTEFIPVKLMEMRSMQNLQGYSMLRATYRAFHTMEAFHGPFIPEEDLIGVNLNGKPKIWLNKNHSKNKADKTIQAQIWQKHLGQVSQNVKRILQMVEQKLQQKHFPREFREYFYNNIMNFSQASEYVEEYCQKYKILIPHALDYTRHIQDLQILAIVKKYNNKRSETLNDRLNTLGSFENSKSYAIIKETHQNTLKRNQSHKNFTYHENSIIPAVNIIKPTEIHNNSNQINGFTFRVVPRSAVKSPTIQRVNTIPVLLNSSQVQNISSLIPIRNIGTTELNLRNIFNAGPFPPVPAIRIQPIQQLRSTISAIPTQVKQLKEVNYENMKTPQHVANNVVFLPPNKISQFQQPQRVEAKSQQENMQLNYLNFDEAQNQYKPCHNSYYVQNNNAQSRKGSIHQKILEFQNDEQILDSSFTKNVQINYPLNQNNETFKEYLQKKQSQINNSRLYEEDNATSQPDWENMQHQKQLHQQMIQREQYYQQQAKKDSDISPIKSSKQKNHENFENQHYSIFSKYANLNQNQKEDQFSDQNANKNITELYQPRNLALSGNIESEEEQQFEESNENSNRAENDQKPSLQSGRYQQNSKDLQSSQRIRHLSSKNTSINKGHNPGQSSGTLVIHQSRQNIYQGINNEQKLPKIFVADIRQESHESDPQDQIQSQQQHGRRNYNFQDQNNIYEKQLEENQRQQEFNSQVNISAQVNQRGINKEYQNLHFRNQSDQLYQYTPVQSVYRKQPGNLQNATHTFSKVQNSGVQQIVKLQRNQDIQNYIRNKYSHLMGASEQPQQNKTIQGRSSYDNRAMTFAKPIQHQIKSDQNSRHVKNYDENNEYNSNENQNYETKNYPFNKIQSHYERIQYHVSTPTLQKQNSVHQQNNDDLDFLDVGNLQKSLDQKYKAAETHQNHMKVDYHKNQGIHNVKGSQTMSEQDGMNVAALQKKLLKFQQRQSIERSKSQKIIEAHLQEKNDENEKELDFHELDNIVELMDKKIQQSQKKQLSNNSSRDITQGRNVSEFNSNKDPLASMDLQSSFTNNQLSNIPVLREQHLSYESNSNPQESNRDNYYKFGIESEDCLTGRGSNSGFQELTKKNSSSANRRSNPTNNYEMKYANNLYPVAQLDKKYQNYSSKNYSTINDYQIPSLAGNEYVPDYRRKSSRRNTKNNSDVQRLADQISSKYDKYITNGKYGTSEYDSSKPFAKKGYYDTIAQESSKNQSTKYVNPASGTSSSVSRTNMQRKRSSYLNTITELYGQNNSSPFKQSIVKKSTYQNNNDQFSIPNLLSSNSLQNNQENNSGLSNRNSKQVSKKNIDPNQKVNGKSSRVSYEQLRDLLWK